MEGRNFKIAFAREERFFKTERTWGTVCWPSSKAKLMRRMENFESKPEYFRWGNWGLKGAGPGEDTLLCSPSLLSIRGRENSIPPLSFCGEGRGAPDRGVPSPLALKCTRGRAPLSGGRSTTHPQTPSPRHNRTKPDQKAGDAACCPHPSHQQVLWPPTPKHSPWGSCLGLYLTITSSMRPWEAATTVNTNCVCSVKSNSHKWPFTKSKKKWKMWGTGKPIFAFKLATSPTNFPLIQALFFLPADSFILFSSSEIPIRD